jgi:aminotransferase
VDYSKIFSQKAQEIKPSGIRKFFNIAAEMEDVISLSIGEPDFKTPLVDSLRGHPLARAGQDLVYSQCGMAQLKVEIAAYLARRFELSYERRKCSSRWAAPRPSTFASARASTRRRGARSRALFCGLRAIAELIGAVPVPIPTRRKMASASPRRRCGNTSPSEPSC